MHRFNIKIADITIGISCAHTLTRRMCGDYLVDGGTPLFTAESTPENEEKLRKIFLSFSQAFSDAYIESIAIYERICSEVLNYDAAVFHAALIALDGEGVAFAAPSSTGKTTHVELWKKLFGDRAEVINGDKPLVTLRGGSFFAGGMPWCGKEGLNVNKTVPLKAVCFLERSTQNRIVPLHDSGEIMRRLLRQLVMPGDDPALMAKYLAFAHRLIKTMPFYLLSCDISYRAVETAHNAIFTEH